MQPKNHDSQSNTPLSASDLTKLAKQIADWAAELGFDGCGITATPLEPDASYLKAWLKKGWQGDMAWMAAHGNKRYTPGALVPGTIRVISLRMNYLNTSIKSSQSLLDHPKKAYISRYALGRDYHKTLRQRLSTLAKRIEAVAGPHGHRVFTDSAPVLEKALARNAGLGWIGKHTVLIHPEQGSLFFLGEIFTTLALPPSPSFAKNHCGSCTKCIDICPTQAIIGANQLDARRCISYLTIEYDGSIPEALRKPIGNRIFGCDDCQLLCPWNRYAQPNGHPDFSPRHGLEAADLVDLFNWSEAQFEAKTEGMPIRRTGYSNWLRNIAVALGNAKTSEAIVTALKQRQNHPNPIIQEHVQWALKQHKQPLT